MQADRNKRDHRGFTLIEIMVVVAIIAILAMIAVPSYKAYVVRGKLTEAFSTLGDFHTRMISFYQDNRSYAGNGACGVAIPSSQNFTYQCVLAGNNLKFTATASSKSGSGLGNAGDYQFNIDQDEIKNTPKFAGAAGLNGSWQDK